MCFYIAEYLYFFVPKVPLEGFKALQGISGPQRFQIHKAYGAPVRLPSAHTWLVLRLLAVYRVQLFFSFLFFPVGWVSLKSLLF